MKNKRKLSQKEVENYLLKLVDGVASEKHFEYKNYEVLVTNRVEDGS